MLIFIFKFRHKDCHRFQDRVSKEKQDIVQFSDGHTALEIAKMLSGDHKGKNEIGNISKIRTTKILD